MVVSRYRVCCVMRQRWTYPISMLSVAFSLLVIGSPLLDVGLVSAAHSRRSVLDDLEENDGARFATFVRYSGKTSSNKIIDKC